VLLISFIVVVSCEYYLCFDIAMVT